MNDPKIIGKIIKISNPMDWVKYPEYYVVLGYGSVISGPMYIAGCINFDKPILVPSKDDYNREIKVINSYYNNSIPGSRLCTSQHEFIKLVKTYPISHVDWVKCDMFKIISFKELELLLQTNLTYK